MFQDTKLSAKELVSDASCEIILNHVFFSQLLMHMKLIEDPSVNTACTDGVRIRYNPTFIESINPDEVAGLLVHEVLHPALGHLWRLPRDKQGNIAGDYAINNFLDTYNAEVGAKRMKLPEGGCINHDWDDLSAEEILSKLPPPPPPPPGDDNGDGKDKVKGRSKSEGGWGEFEEPTSDAGNDDEDPMTPEELQGEWERRIVQAATATKMVAGKLPGCIEALVDHLVNPVVPWEQVLERFVDATASSDYTYKKPDRRFIADDIIIPDLHDETLGTIVVALDTSGSIYGVPEVLASFETELNGILQRCRPEKTIVIQCDARVTQVDEYPAGDTITLRPKGGGGTDFRPVGDYIKKHNLDPRVVIYLTDLEGVFPPQPGWDFPTIWCVYNNPEQVAPFGETVHLPALN
jgi:predicted metal-dependent peptidase